MNLIKSYKPLHVVSACSWFGSVLAVVLIFLFTKNELDHSIMISNNKLIERIDHWIIIPSSVLCYFTGIILSWKTNWGFLKYKWIVTKLIIGSLLMLFGIFFLGPWILKFPTISITEFSKYNNLQLKLGVSMITQSVFILIIIIISTTKPWGKTNLK